MDIFEGPYYDAHYNTAYDPADKTTYYLFNPESIVKVCKESMEDTIENLYTRKQYDEALDLLSNLWQNKLMTLSNDELNKLFIGPMIAKTRNSKFNHLLLSGDMVGARE